MKIRKLNLICIAAIIASMFSTVSAQQTFRVYRNDGTMELFFYTTLDSITFSPADESELSDGYGFTQNIHTTDSVYHFLTSEIDSIAFQPLPTVYKPGIVRIEGRLRDYVTGSDSLTLFVRTSIPETLLPKPGDDVATLDCDDILPYGFLGHVEKITRTTESIQIGCSQVSLLDIFDSLGLEGTSTSDTNETAASRGALDVWPPVHDKFVVPTLKKSFPLSHEIKAPGGLTQTYDMNVYGELSTQSCEVNWAYLITPMPFQTPHIHWSLTYTAQQSVSVGGSFGSTVKWEKKLPFVKQRNIRMPGAAAVIEFFNEAGVFIEIEGEIGLNASFTKPFTTVIHASYDNKTQTAIAPRFSMIGRDAVTESMLEGSASVTLGLYGKLGIAPLVKEIATIEAEFKAGATFSSSINLAAGVAPIEILNTEMYDEMNRDDFYRVDLSLTGEVTETVLGNPIQSNGLEIGDLVFKNPIFKRGSVPRFDNVTLTDEGDKGSLTASATLNRKLMFDVPVGFALYDDNKKFVDKWWADGEYKNNEGRKITHKFEGLKANTTYTLHPITRAFNDNMVANPSATSKIDISLDTWDAIDIKGSSAKLRGYVKGLSDEDNYTCGFNYWTDSSLNPETATYIEATEISEGVFTARVNNLQPETTYYFKSCLLLNGTTTVATSVKQFTALSTGEITCTMEQLDLMAFNDNYKHYKGIYKIQFQNLGNRKLHMEDWGRSSSTPGSFQIVSGENYSNVSLTFDGVWHARLYDNNEWIAYIGNIFVYPDNNPYFYAVINFKCDDKEWINMINSGVATFSKPCGLKIHYDVFNGMYNTGEEGDIIGEFNVRYDKKPEIKDLRLVRTEIDEANADSVLQLRFNVSGAHWIKNVEINQYVSGRFVRFSGDDDWIEEKEELIDKFKPEIADSGSFTQEDYYNAINVPDIDRDQNSLNEILYCIDPSYLADPIIHIKYVLTYTLIDGTTSSCEFSIPIDLREARQPK